MCMKKTNTLFVTLLEREKIKSKKYNKIRKHIYIQLCWQINKKKINVVKSLMCSDRNYHV